MVVQASLFISARRVSLVVKLPSAFALVRLAQGNLCTSPLPFGLCTPYLIFGANLHYDMTMDKAIQEANELMVLE
jgi:hypothetical protein